MLFEVLLSFVPIIFFITGIYFLCSDLFYYLYAKEVPAKVIAIEKYVSRTGHHHNSTKGVMYRELVEFYISGVRYLFFSGGKNFISKEIGSLVSVYSYKNNPNIIRLKKSNHFLFGVVFTAASLVSGYLMVYQRFDYLNFLISCLIIIVGLPSFYFYLKRKSKGELNFQSLFKTDLVDEDKLKGREIFWNSKDLGIENTRNAKSGLVITSIFILFYGFIFKICYDQLTNSELEILKSFFLKFENIEEVMTAASRGPVVGVLFCLMLAPLLLHSILYSLKRL